jgi:glutathione synthase/RimK-type ligase-like ATP-grasp enzyme
MVGLKFEPGELRKPTVEKMLVCKPILDAMMVYQLKHNITRMCISNTQFFLDCVKQNHPELKPKSKAVIVVNDDVVCVHLVVELGGMVIDSSHEIVSTRNKLYFDTFADLKRAKISLANEKWILSTYLDFVDYAKRMNEGQLLIVNKAYYDSQADFVASVVNGKRIEVDY